MRHDSLLRQLDTAKLHRVLAAWLTKCGPRNTLHWHCYSQKVCNFDVLMCA